MKSSCLPARWIVALLLTAFLVSGCKIWDPRTWSLKPRPRQVQRFKYEANTPYAALGAPAPADRLTAVSGMGYDNSMAFFPADGRRMISESSPANDGVWAQPSQQTATAAAGDDQNRRERSGPSFSESRMRSEGMSVQERAPSADPFAGLPSGIPVPGKPGFVNLPDSYSGLPEIDVRGISSGTPVEVPNPLKPGEKIRFRVP